MNEREKAIVKELYRAKSNHIACIAAGKRIEIEHKTAYCTAAKDLIFNKWNGHHPVEKNTKDVKIPKGTTLKIVMVSRFGDCGLTDNLKADHGYHLRVDFDDDGDIEDIRWNVKKSKKERGT